MKTYIKYMDTKYIFNFLSMKQHDKIIKHITLYLDTAASCWSLIACFAFSDPSNLKKKSYY